MPRIAISTGVTLDYFETGNCHGEAIIFVHGYIDSWRVWESTLPFLPHENRLVYLTQRGFGDSDKPDTGYTQLDYVRDLEAFVDALGIPTATVVGHSMGGFVAHHFTIRNPERVTKLVLVGTAPSGHESDIIAGSVPHKIANLTDPIDPAFVRHVQTEQIGCEIPLPVVDTIVYESTKAPARVWRKALKGMLEEDHSKRLSEIVCPTLILFGEKDIFFTISEQRDLERTIPNARLKIYPQVGHGVHWEKPGEFANDLREFLDR